MNFFKLYDIAPTPAIADHTFVTSRYKQLQKKYHPDFYSQAGEQEKEEVMQKSAAVNEGYNTFKDQQKLLAYYLREKNIITDDEKPELPPVFLMEVMDINEALTEGNSAESTASIASLQHQLDQMVAPVFAKEAGDIDANDLQQLKDYYYKKKYLQRILDRI